MNQRKDVDSKAASTGNESDIQEHSAIESKPKSKGGSQSPCRGWQYFNKGPTVVITDSCGNVSVAAHSNPQSQVESNSDLDGKNLHPDKPLSSPTSPSLMLKHSSLFSATRIDPFKRRGSESMLDVRDKKAPREIQVGVTDRRWQKLRSILVDMKDEPINFDFLDTSSREPSSSGSEKSSLDGGSSCLQRQITELNSALKKRESDMATLETEKNAAVAYICKLSCGPAVNVNEPDSKLPRQNVDHDLQALSDESLSKEQVVEVASNLLQEVMSQRAYLQRLLSVVLTHAPHLLEYVDKTNQSTHLYADDRTQYDGGDDSDISSSVCCIESDDEVWC